MTVRDLLRNQITSQSLVPAARTNGTASDLDGAFTAVSGSSGSNTIQQVGYVGS